MVTATWHVLALLALPPQTEASVPLVPDVEAFVERHCLACHAGEAPEADLDLASALPGAAAEVDVDLWQYAAERVEDGDMPPRGSARPGPSEREAFLAWVATLAAPAPAAADPGRAALRRLNHDEYRNSVHDLFGVDLAAVDTFPADGVAHGFRTSGEALPLTELLLEKYVEAAELVAREAVLVPGPSRRLRLGPARLSGGHERGDVRVLATRGEVAGDVELPRRGTYVLRARVHAQQAGDELARLVLTLDGRALAGFEVTAEPGASELHELRALLDGGVRRLGAAFPNDFYDPEHEDPSRRDRNLHVHWIEVEGPLDDPRPTPFQRDLAARFPPSLGEQRLEAALADLAPRVWRRPVDGRALARLVEFARSGDQPGFEHALRRAVLYLCSSPRFLLRLERDEPGPLDGHELATRLAHLAWSTTPDRELLERAADGSLVRDDELARQLARLLDDPRSERMVAAFARGWLGLEALEDLRLDPARFPGFEERRASMLRETALTLEHLLREERSLWELLEGDETFVDQRLAELYGIEGVRGPRFVRVSLAGTPRRGLLGQASVLALTSDPTRTSPVKRGRWILDVLLGAPPPPPPPDVPALAEAGGHLDAASMREQLELHRADPTCAVCHDRMDPLGFGLENFDAQGAWREEDGGHPIDAAGLLPDGRGFEGPLELLEVLRADDAFLRALAERFLVFAVGRELRREDREHVRAILDRLDPERPTLRGLVEAVVLSAPFRERGPAPSATSDQPRSPELP